MMRVRVDGAPPRRGRGIATLCAALLLVATPAAAQTEPYPPVGPDEPGASIACELGSRPGVVTAGCTGQGLDPDGRLELEVTLDEDGPVVAQAGADVGSDQTARADAEVDCGDLDGSVVTVTGTSTDPDGREVTGSARGDVDRLCDPSTTDPGAPADPDEVTDVGGTDEERGPAEGGAAGATGGPGGGLPFTGQDIGLLVAIALLLALAGFGLTRGRPRRPA